MGKRVSGTITRFAAAALAFATSGALLTTQTTQGGGQQQPGDLQQPSHKTTQGTPIDPSRPNGMVVPDRVIYQFFIYHVGREDDEVQQKKAAGEDTSKMRWDYKNMIGLTEDETTIMLSVTVDGYHAMKAKDEEFNRLAQTERAKYIAAYTASNGAKPPVPPELQQISADEVALISATMDNIKRSLGDESFSRLDGFIHRNWGPHNSMPTGRPGAAPTITTVDSPPIQVQRQ